MPEDRKPPTNNPRRHRPRLEELASETTEEDLWDLDDDLDQPEAAATSAVEEAPEAEPEPAQEELELEPAEEPVEEETETLEEEEENALPEPTPEPEPVADPTPAPAEEVVEATEPTPEASEVSRPIIEKPQGKERIGLIVLAVVFLGLGIWWIAGLMSDVPTTRLGEDEPDFPIAGRFIEAKSATSFWRTPIREGDQADIARADILAIPVLEVSITGSGDGVLRAIFRDDQGEFVGDSITRTFTSGHFDQSNSPTVEFPATSGFTEDAEFNAYRVGGDRWSVEILEGPSANASGSEFKSLFKAPVSSIRR